jgi:methylated-DNA-[protein]-cysteine S-methyltransferase
MLSTVIVRVAVPSPIGQLAVFARGDHVVALDLPGTSVPSGRYLARRFGAEPQLDADDALEVRGRLVAYFAGDLRALDAVPVDTAGTPFQRAVWAALRRIPAGTTWSYADVARAVGAPAAVRAVGAANGANPVAIVIPCHRVVRTGGALGGYGGGLERKRWLLAHERAALPAGALVQRALFTG